MRTRISGPLDEKSDRNQLVSIQYATYSASGGVSLSTATPTDIWGTTASPILSVDVPPGGIVRLELFMCVRMDMSSASNQWMLSYARIVETSTSAVVFNGPYQGILAQDTGTSAASSSGKILPYFGIAYWVPSSPGRYSFKVQGYVYANQTCSFHYQSSSYLPSTLTATVLRS